FFTRRRRHTRFSRDWSSDVCSSDLAIIKGFNNAGTDARGGELQKLRLQPLAAGHVFVVKIVIEEIHRRRMAVRGGNGNIGRLQPGGFCYPRRHRMLQQQRSGRSEEHTSELQSRENLVCRLLLEKKKKKCK